MPRLTRRNGDGDGDLIACFGCNYEERPVEDCGVCPHFTEALEKLATLEDQIEREREERDEEYD